MSFIEINKTQIGIGMGRGAGGDSKYLISNIMINVYCHRAIFFNPVILVIS